MKDQLDSFIRSAKDKLKQISGLTEETDKKTQTIEVVETCLRVLDYTVNNFPDGIKAKKGHTYFPRPGINEKSGDYFKRVQDTYSGLQMVNFKRFIKESFDVICTHKKSISHIESKVKHETPPEIHNSFEDHKVEYQIEIIGDPKAVLPISMNEDGIKVGNLVHAIKGSSFSIKNSIAVNKDGIAVIDNLQYGMTTVDKNAILLKNGNKISLEKWLGECVATCEEIAQLFQKF
jgi:hypothetical protein